MPDSTNPFIGLWSLESCKGVYGDKSYYPLGQHPFGMLTYTDKAMMVFISSLSRIPFNTSDLRTISPDEVMADFTQFESYCGRYDIDNKQSIISHHIQSSKIPNHIGTTLSRRFSFQSGVLLLKSMDSLLLNDEPWLFELTWSKQD